MTSRSAVPGLALPFRAFASSSLVSLLTTPTADSSSSASAATGVSPGTRLLPSSLMKRAWSFLERESPAGGLRSDALCCGCSPSSIALCCLTIPASGTSPQLDSCSKGHCWASTRRDVGLPKSASALRALGGVVAVGGSKWRAPETTRSVSRSTSLTASTTDGVLAL
uniref:Putative secreted protein n=1 Tax=Ixodes ricinus TaxID=34613 RepID=A0A6B0UZG3_IXORI